MGIIYLVMDEFLAKKKTYKNWKYILEEQFEPQIPATHYQQQ